MSNKKGLSDVITTVLIILLVLAAVALIWGFIRTPIESSGKQIESTGECFKVELTPKSCVVNATNPNSQNATITVQWTGGDAVAVQSLVLLATDKNGKVATIPAASPAFLGTTSATVNITGLADNTTIQASAAAVIKTKSGNIATCTASLAKVGCA
ncbi:MAG: archaellin/type IV pilin N-terminal domain-containing protein [archaeon]